MALILQEHHEDALRVARAALALGPSCAAAPALRQHIRNALRGLGREDGEVSEYITLVHGVKRSLDRTTATY